MDSQDFLHTGELRLEKTGMGVERLLVQVAEKHGLHEFLDAYDPANAAAIMQHAERLRAQIDLTFNASGASGLTDRGGKPYNRKKMKAIKHGLTKRNDAKLQEIVALGLHSGALLDPKYIHVHDLGSGKGPLLFGLSFLRGDHERTSGVAWEREEGSEFGFRLTKKLIAADNPGLEYRSNTILEADLSAPEEREAYVLAKHACGTATDDALSVSLQTRDATVGILSCCHSKAKNVLPAGMEELLSAAEWKRIASYADPQQGDGRDPYRMMIRRLAMRVVDTLRVVNIHDPSVTMREVLPAAVSTKNHAILFKTGEAS